MSIAPIVFDWAAAGLALLAIVWTALPLLRHDAWWIRVFEFPRIQVLVLTAAVLTLYLAIAGWRDPEDWILSLVLVGCMGFQARQIFPYTPLAAKQVTPAADPSPEHVVSVLVANVLTPNRNAEGLLRLIRSRNPDLVLTLESDRWWESQLHPLEADYPHTVKHPLDNLYGMHLYSRLPLEDPKLLFLVEDEVPSIHARVVLRSGQTVDLHCLHPAPPSPTENPTSAERDAELLLVARTIDARVRSTIVMGDLNDVAWSATTQLFQRLSALLDPRVGRGMFSTFHADYRLLRWPLDHVFCSPDFALVALERLPSFGSDHFPIYAALAHTPAAGAVHEPLTADGDDRAWAEEKIGKADADTEALGSFQPGRNG